MRVFPISFVMVTLLSINLSAQVTGLSGWDICLDPGHSQTDNMGIYNYSEAEKNLRVGLRLREMLLNETDIDTVYITRTNDQQIVSLSQRTDYANGNEERPAASWFHSIHSNAPSQQVNTTLLIWGQLNNGNEKNPSGGKAMSDIMIGKLTNGMRTNTVYGSIGDCDLYTSWGSTYCQSSGGPYLYINRNTDMPSELSEAGFHTNPIQNQLNMNEDWKRLEARTFYWSILDFHNIPRPQVRILTGIVRNEENGQPINGAEIFVNDFVYVTDTYESLFYKYSANPDFLRNGFYYFEGIDSDSVDVIAQAEGFVRDTIRVAMNDTFFTFVDFKLISNAPTYVKSTYPVDGDSSFSILDGMGIEFSRAMNRASVDTTLVIVPEIALDFIWAADDRRLLIVSDSLEFLTQYRITVSGKSEDRLGHQLDGNNDGVVGDDFSFSFKTSSDTDPPVIQTKYPEYNKRDVELLPLISLTYNEELDPETVTADLFNVERAVDNSYIDLDMAHYIVNNKSVINLFPLQSLIENERYTTRISGGLKDLYGNMVNSSFSYPFNTGMEEIDISSIDNFESGVENWWQPDQSFHTTGILMGTIRNSNQEIVNLLGTSTKSMVLDYEWDLNESSWMIRLYLNDGTDPKNVEFDTSHVLQVYVFGDGSGNRMRFCVDDKLPELKAENHEVSNWYTIDWIGWKLIEWNLSDPNQVGEWIGDGSLDGNLRFDSIQLTYTEGAISNSQLYFDDLSIVNKYTILDLHDITSTMPENFSLSQNFPNPFNPTTQIKFSLVDANFTSLTIYDITGRSVQTLVKEGLSAGEYEVVFDAGDLASGTYFYVLNSGSKILRKKMILLK